MSEIGLSPVPETDPAVRDLRQHFLAVVTSATKTTEKLHRFPGTMPMTLSRRHLHMVGNNDYVALEKSDGTRYMLLAVTDFVVLIDRQMRFYLIEPNPEILGKGFEKRQDNTILDGELTFNKMTQQYEYLIYDSIAIDGDVSVAQRGFRERMQAAEVFVAGPRLWAPFCSGLLRLRIKDYYEEKDIRKLFSRIRKNAKGHYLYINNDRRDGVLCNENDGVIFAPVGMPYQVRNCFALLKWKPPHLNSIDFTLQLEHTVDQKRNNQPSVRSYIAYKGERGLVRLREVYLQSKLRRQMAANYNDYDNKVVEMAYDRMAGEWKYIRMREDKAGPNFATTVIDTMETIAESMEREELVRFLEKHSKPPPQREIELIKSVAKNEADCTFRNDYFDEDNESYLITTPISQTRPPFMMPPRKPPGRGPPRYMANPQPKIANGDADGTKAETNGSAPTKGGRAPVEYSEDV